MLAVLGLKWVRNVDHRCLDVGVFASDTSPAPGAAHQHVAHCLKPAPGCFGAREAAKHGQCRQWRVSEPWIAGAHAHATRRA